jgi:putative membrane protein
MKTLQILLFGGLVGCLGACHNPDQKWDSKSSADTLNNMKDSVANPSVSVTKDLVMKVSKDDARFAVAAAAGGLAEVELGRLAQQNASDARVKDFGAMMVNDHSRADDELKVLAKSKGISLPATLDNGEQKIKDKLAAKSGPAFDKAYVSDMIDDHKQDIREFEDAAKTLKDPELKAFAVRTLPVLKKHLDAVLKIHHK